MMAETYAVVGKNGSEFHGYKCAAAGAGVTLGSRAANLSGTVGRVAPSPAPPTLEAPPLAAIDLEFVVRDLI